MDTVIMLQKYIQLIKNEKKFPIKMKNFTIIDCYIQINGERRKKQFNVFSANKQLKVIKNCC